MGQNGPIWVKMVKNGKNEEFMKIEDSHQIISLGIIHVFIYS